MTEWAAQGSVTRVTVWAWISSKPMVVVEMLRRGLTTVYPDFAGHIVRWAISGVECGQAGTAGM